MSPKRDEHQQERGFGGKGGYVSYNNGVIQICLQCNHVAELADDLPIRLELLFVP
jgi:hypothetical protein